MKCNECEETNPCGCNEEPCVETTTGCPVKDLSTDCVTYTGDDTDCAGIKKNTILTKVIQDLSSFVCNKFDEAINYLTLVNVGSGAKVFRGITGLGSKEIRTIEQGADILVTEETDTIKIANPSATENQKGVIEIATQLEVATGTDAVKAVTPATLSSHTADPTNLPSATTIQKGVVELATQAEVDTGTDAERAVTPATLKVRVEAIVSDPANLPDATTIQKGVIEIATQAEVDTGTDTERAVTPATLNAVVSNPTNLPSATTTQKGVIEIATQTEVDTGTDTERAVTPATLNAVISEPENLPNATESQRGIAEIATQTEVDAGTDNEKIVTPAKLNSRIANINIGLQATTVDVNSWSYAAAQTVTHNIGSAPLFALVKAVCVNVEAGYAVGDVITITSSGHAYEVGGGDDDGGLTITLNGTTSSTLAISNRIVGIQKTGNSNFNLNEGDWDLRIIFLHT